MQDIRRKKVPLTEALMSDLEFILTHVEQKNLITRREYANIRSRHQRSDEGKVIDLLDKIMDKGDKTCRSFWALLQEDAVQKAFPSLEELCSGAATGTTGTGATGLTSRPEQETGLGEIQVMAEKILGILDQLQKEKFERFKFYLNGEVLQECTPIPMGQLEDKNQREVIQLMKSFYGNNLVKITREILKKIDQNDLIQKLDSNQETGQQS